MAKGDTGALGLMRNKQPMSNTNQYGEQKPLGWQNLVQPTFSGSGGAAPKQMGQMAGNMGMGMRNFLGAFGQRPNLEGQGNLRLENGGFNAGPSFGSNRGINPGGMYNNRQLPQMFGPNQGMFGGF